MKKIKKLTLFIVGIFFVNYLCVYGNNSDVFSDSLEKLVKKSSLIVFGAVKNVEHTGMGEAIGDKGNMISTDVGHIAIKVEDVIKGSVNKNDEITINFFLGGAISFNAEQKVILFVDSSSGQLGGSAHVDKDNDIIFWDGDSEKHINMSVSDFLLKIKQDVSVEVKNEKK